MPYSWVQVNDKYGNNPLCDDLFTLHLQTEMYFVSTYSEICYNANDAHWVRCYFPAILLEPMYSRSAKGMHAPLYCGCRRSNFRGSLNRTLWQGTLSDSSTPFICVASALLSQLSMSISLYRSCRRASRAQMAGNESDTSTDEATSNACIVRALGSSISCTYLQYIA